MEGPDRWGGLSPYTLALIGYGVEEHGVEQTVIALYFPDPAAAENNAQELGKRWTSFHFDPRISGREEETPVASSCSTLFVGILKQAGSSVLTGTCRVIRAEDRDPKIKGPDLWLSLFHAGELHFLSPDLEKLKEASEEQ